MDKPELLPTLVTNLGEIIKLEEQKITKIRALKWEFTRQMHLNAKEFWLTGLTPRQLIDTFDAHCNEYTLVFGEEHPSRNGNLFQDSLAWSKWQEKHWKERQDGSTTQ